MVTKIGFSGSQEGMSDSQKVRFLSRYLFLKRTLGGDIEFHQGQCIGADHEALLLAKSQGGVWTVSHPPTDQSKVHDVECDEVWPAKPYLERNHDIVDATDYLIFAPKTRHEQLRSGTWATYRYAKLMRKNILMLHPDELPFSYLSDSQ